VRRRVTRYVNTAAIGAAVAAVLGGCATVPTSGPIRSGSGAGDVGDPAYGIQVQAPRPGAGARAIVNDFLDAMATSGPDVFKQYLTPQAAASWRPDDSVIVFDRSKQEPIQPESGLGGSTDVTLSAPKVATLDARGGWHGARQGEQPVKFTFKLVKVKGELRISNAPGDRLVASDLFTSNYRARNLYFFTPAGDALVPDPLYLPVRTSSGQNATGLVQALLAGPTDRLGDSVRTVAPGGTEVVSVTVDADGVATVALNDRITGLGPDGRPKLAAQLAWTLRQVGVLKLKITAAGQPYEVDGTTAEQAVSHWDSYDAAFASRAGRQLYVLSNNEVAPWDNLDATTDQAPQDSSFRGLTKLPIESFAVDLEGQNGAAVTDGAVIVGSLGQTPRPATIHTGGHVLRPSFDKDRNLWIVDQAGTAARIRVRRDGGQVLTVRAPDLEGRKITTFRVARDGVRVVAVLQTAKGSQVVLGRITGSQRSWRIAVVQALQPPYDDVADAGWSSPNKIMLLGRIGAGPYQMAEVNIDGSQLAQIQGNGAQDFNPVELAVAPDVDALPVVRNNGELLVRQRDLNWARLTTRGHPVNGHAVYPG
jgi:spore germination protein GerM